MQSLDSFFFEDEQKAISKFDNYCQEQQKLLFALMEHTEHFINQLSGNVKANDYPAATIELFIVYNLTHINSSYNLLRRGYFGLAFSDLRSLAEKLSLSFYFYCFAEEEKQYRKDHKKFYDILRRTNPDYGEWIRGLLRRIDKECDNLKINGMNRVLEESVWDGFGKEASDFLHANPDTIRFTVMGVSTDNFELYSLGPNYLGEIPSRIIMLKILSAAILNLMACDKIFPELIRSKDHELIDFATSSINAWQSAIKERIIG